MKTRFSTYDIICGVTELQSLIGLRVNQIYDTDNKTYLIRLQNKDVKMVLLLESGSRFHTTEFEWPKNVAPNGFTMKLRKHLKNKRLEKLTQLGIDRIIDLQFGIGEAAYHVIVEMYDRGNIILTDCEMVILNILRPHVEGEEVRFAVREKYPECRARDDDGKISENKLIEILNNAKPGENLKKIFNPILPFGPAVIEHILTKHDLMGIKIPKVNNEDSKIEKSGKGKKQSVENVQNRIFDFKTDIPKMLLALEDGYSLLQNATTDKPKGYIIQKREIKPQQQSDEDEYFLHNIEYHPCLFVQHQNQPYKEFESFNVAVDEFYSTLEGQKIDVKTMHQEREALKKLSNVKKDHEKRLHDLTKTQIFDKQRAELITRNQELVDNAIFAIRSAIANQMSWPDINNWVKSAQSNNDPVAAHIKELKLETNHISMYLTDPYEYDDNEEEEEDEDDEDKLKPMVININLGLSAYSNATRYYDQKRSAAKKEQRTIESSVKALKSAERKTQQTLKEVRTISNISKARKVFWFEKFYWFISTENYLIIGGRDQQQNELIVKRYMRPNDIYVHAEIQGASSVVIRNPSGGEVPPKTLLEAGTMAISYSVAWDAKVVTNAYWVRSDQVSKTAPTGEYLGTGSFMIRGKKNFLPPCHLILGLSFLFKLEDGSIARHAGERRIRTFDDEQHEDMESIGVENEKLDDIPEEEQEIELLNSDNEDECKPVEDNRSSSDDENNSQYPDTHVKIQHDTGNVELSSNTKLERLISEISVQSDEIIPDEDSGFIIHAAAQRVKQPKQKKTDKKKGNKNEMNFPDNSKNINSDKTTQRRQKGKLRKIKEKYKDQDEEERQIRMAILKSAGTVVEKQQAKATEMSESELEKKEKNDKTKLDAKSQQIQSDDVDDYGDIPIDVDMLDSLTGCPQIEDEILFAVPVVAPYQSLQNFKFKVKLTPGTGRRGKVSKTAINLFLNDKTCSPREKDLLKGVKDEIIARNIPGKVKLSAPQMHKHKK